MPKTITRVTQATNNRVAISFNTDVCQSLMFLTGEEFLYLMGQMFEYRDSHREDFERLINNIKQR